MDRSWYERPMRIAALQCDFEGGQTLDVIDKWLDAGFNVEQLFHPMAESYTAIFEPEKHAGILSRYLKRARKKGLRIILYQNVHIIPPSMESRREEWAMRDRGGGYQQLYGTYYGCCVNSPWRHYFFSVLETLAPYEIDGLFLDGPAMGDGCFCPSCRQRYREEEEGELLEADDPWQFFMRSRSEFVREVYTRFKRLKPQAVCYWNVPAMHPSGSYVSLQEELPFNDLVGTEGGFMFYGPARGAYLWGPGVAARTLEAIAPHKPRVIFMAADHKPWSWYPHTPVETQLCVASSVANGANIWYGLHGSTQLLQTPGCRAATRLMRFLAEHEQYYDSTRSAARVAVMLSYATERFHQAAQESDFYGSGKGSTHFRGDFAQAFRGFCGLLARSAVPFDVVADLALSQEQLAGYDCVLLPTCACLSDGAVEALRDYVDAGGNVISSFGSGLYGSDGKRRDRPALGDVLGVSGVNGTTEYANFNYFSPCGEHWLFSGVGLSRLPAPELGLDVELAGSAEVLARFHRPQPGRYTDPTPQDKPAILLNHFGDGTSLYFAGTFAETAHSYALPEYRVMLGNALGVLSHPVVALEGGTGNVELTVREQGRRLIVHLINHAGLPPRPFEQVAPRQGLRLRVAAERGARSGVALMAGSECRLERRGGDAIIDLPTLGTYEVVVVE